MDKLSEGTILQMSEGLVNDLKLKTGDTLEFCESCQFGKQSRTALLKEAVKCVVALELVHSDVYGLMPTESVGGNKYFVTFTDHFTR